MLDIGWQELFIVGVVLLIFIKPRDIPSVIVNIRDGMQKLRQMAREFHNTLDDLIEESQVMSVKEAFDSQGRDIMGDLEKRMEDIDVDPRPTSKSKLKSKRLSAKKPKKSVKKPVKKTAEKATAQGKKTAAAPSQSAQPKQVAKSAKPKTKPQKKPA